MQEVNPNRSKCILTSKIAIAVCVGVILIIGIIVAIYISRSTKTSTRIPTRLKSPNLKSPYVEKLCETKQCLKQAARILANMDTSVNPCTDFYNFTCGNFTRHATIPEDQTRLLLALENKKLVEDELVKAYNTGPGQFNSLLEDMKMFYRQCVDAESYKKTNYRSIRQMLLKLKWPVFYKNWNIKYAHKFNWLDWEARFSEMGLASVFLNTELKFDMRNFSVAYIGLDCTIPSLPKKVLALGRSGKFIKKYAHVLKRALKIIARKHNGKTSVEIIDFFLKIEKIKPTRYEMSDSNFFNAFQNISVGVLANELKIDLESFLNKILPPSLFVTSKTILGTNSHPCLIKTASFLNAADKRQTANFMIWKVVQNLLWIISNETRLLDFELKHARTGIQAPVPLYKQCLNFIDDHIPELSSAMYVKMYYSENKRKNLEKMVKLLLTELEKVVNAATWMDDPTKKIAKTKVRKLPYVIDHINEVTEDKYLYSVYANLDMTSPKLIQNIRNIKKAAYNHMMETYNWTAAKRNQVTLLPLAHVINAFYHPGLNSIAIPAGIAHGSIYSDEQEAYLNFGAIGIIIGHELSHVFDNTGRLYDADGNYVNWWSNKSNSKFEEKSQCFIKQYDNYKLGPKLKINGTLTLGENMADTGGTLLAYRAYLNWEKKCNLKKLPGLENFSAEQMFWISVGNTWCDKLRPETLDMFLKTDVHSLGNFRVIGPLSNIEEFSRDFKCPAGSKMNPLKKCTVW